MKRWAGAGLFLAAAVALGLRGGGLSQRPLHNDEAINAYKLERLWKHGEYRYDPTEYHGPALYYFSLPVLAVAARFHPDQPDEVSIRAVSVVFGVGLILLMGLIADGLGWPEALVAAGLTAVSPAMVYYSRYYIHELPLVFFTFLMLASVWRYIRRPGTGWALAAGGALGLMYATKETFVFALAAAVAAAALTIVAEPSSAAIGLHPSRDRLSGPSKDPWRGAASRIRRFRGSMRTRHWIAAAGAAVGFSLVLYSSFFTNGQGIVDALRTYLIWLKRAGGASPHVHPWYFYFQRLTWFHERGGPVWTEAAIVLLAGVAAIVVLRNKVPAQRRQACRFLLLYTALLAALYCLLPYKTPWCLLGFFHGMILLAGIGACAVLRKCNGPATRALTALLFLGACGHLAWQSWRLNVEFPADVRNPYVYGHTAPDVFNLLNLVQGVARVSPDGDHMPLQVMAPDFNYWPLPWYWRQFDRAGWWDHVPENPFSPVIVVASKLKASLEEKSNQAWLMVGLFELRPKFFVELYVEKGLWSKYLAREK